MSFRVMVDRSIECDTIDEVRQAIELLDGQLSGSELARVATVDNGHAGAELIDDSQQTAERVKRAYRRKPPMSGQSRSWDEARKEAKRQGREDIAAVRSELAEARRQAG